MSTPKKVPLQSNDSEIFSKPFVKEVHFEIKFPNLFYIENKIGDFQLKILNKFPESSLAFRKPVVFADIGPEFKFDDKFSQTDMVGKKIWQFKSDHSKLDITSDSLNLSTNLYKVYDHKGEENFRSLIEFVVSKFLEVTAVPHITRLGLRYVNECIIDVKTTESINNYYNTLLPINKFKVENTDEYIIKLVHREEGYGLIYQEAIPKNNKFILLDLDGFLENFNSSEYLAVTDKLHTLIKAEFNNYLKEPAKQKMREE